MSMTNIDLREIFTKPVLPKIEDTEITWIGKRLGGRGAAPTPEKSYLYVSSSTTKAGVKRTCITFYKDIIKELRLMVGDQVMIGEDKQKNIIIKRVKQDGYVLGCTSKKETHATKLSAQIPYLENKPKYYPKSEVLITDDGMIYIKKEEAVA